MSNAPLLYVLMGLLFGTTLLAVGMALGFWMAKRTSPTEATLSPKFIEDQQQMLSVIRSMANWTSDFAGDFNRYQSTMEILSRTASDGKTVRTKEEVQKLLDQIVNANNHLQSRLDSAEQKLELQTKQLAGYLNEARTDGLTQLPNRRSFDQKMDECYAKWQQSKQCFSLALIDIDHFKLINDNYGHPAGDAVLKAMAAHLNEIKSDSLLVARYGGEEFGVIFEGDEKSAAATIEKLRLAIAANLFHAEGHEIPVTISSGVAKISGDERIGKLVRRSDEALYSAKLGGRNRVVVHNGLLCELYGNPSPIHSTESKSTAADDHPSSSNDLASKDVEHRVLARLDQLVSQETNRTK
jgi:diguanylate cyclase